MFENSFDGIKKGDKFHFIAIGGVGQSALAKILIKMGYNVSGSDISDSKYIKELKQLGAKIFIGHNAKNVPEDDIKNTYIVLSSAIKEDNPELVRSKELGLKILHRSDLLLAITHEFALTIGFSGTHGKTTTSGLASFLLSKAGKKPAFAAGGIISGLNTNANADKHSNVFIAELDESDGTIIKYTPEILVINNLEADHPDFYKNGLSDVLNVFKNLIQKQPKDAKIIINSDDEGIKKLLGMLDDNELKKIIRFSVCTENNFESPADYTAKNINFTTEGAEFDINFKNFTKKVSTSLKGMHNVCNCLAVICALIEAGYNFEEFSKYIKDFNGMARRFQSVFKNENIEIIDDYAHHPAEIKATLNAAKEYKIRTSKKRVVAIFQPHRYTRLKGLWDEFLSAFNDCDKLIVTDVFSAGDMPDKDYNSKNFTLEMQKNFKDKEVCYKKGKIDEISNDILNHIQSGDIVLTLGAGDITKLGLLLGENL